MSKIKKVDLAWLSGIVDGEGCFTIFRRTNRSGSGKIIVSPSASATITNSNSRMMEKCKSLLDVIGIKYAYHSPRNSCTRPLRRIRVSNYESLALLISQIKPYLVAKVKQVKIIEEFLKLVIFRHPVMREEKMRLLEAIQWENKFGSQIL